MGESEDESEAIPLGIKNETVPSRGRPRSRDALYNLTSTFPHYFIPKRPRVIKMRDLSPSTKAKLSKEYYEVYDPWTGIRIAATLGILISLFTLFLTYKSKYHKSRNAVVTSKKTSLYLYEEDLDCDLGNLDSSDDTGSFAYSFRYGVDDRLPGGHEYHFGLKNDYPIDDVFVKSSVVECVALTVHKNKKGSKGPKYGTLRITEDAPRSLPCSPYEKKKIKTSTPVQGQSSMVESTKTKQPFSPMPSPATRKGGFPSGSITSFGSTDIDDSPENANAFSKPMAGSSCRTEAVLQSMKLNKHEGVGESDSQDHRKKAPTVPTHDVLSSSKRPQDYRSRSTVVTIGRRKRKS